MKVSPQRMTDARLAANMSRADLAAALRQATRGHVKASERGIRGWEKGEYAPSADVLPAYAEATGKPIEFFYADDESGSDDDEEESSLALTRDLVNAIQKVVVASVREAVRA